MLAKLHTENVDQLSSPFGQRFYNDPAHPERAKPLRGDKSDPVEEFNTTKTIVETRLEEHRKNTDHFFCWKLSNFQSCPPKKLFKKIDVQR